MQRSQRDGVRLCDADAARFLVTREPVSHLERLLARVFAGIARSGATEHAVDFVTAKRSISAGHGVQPGVQPSSGGPSA
ncbi:MAG: hypothetical protein CSA58_03485 [Micrococcales bacterium]|nr:MAG: hypothetical protein CSB46_01585 [Micrococcales bacterium]PIE27582.1 MAG: hypothetical protein CSA58_03485 [Micrococcales bacterium]